MGSPSGLPVFYHLSTIITQLLFNLKMKVPLTQISIFSAGLPPECFCSTEQFLIKKRATLLGKVTLKVASILRKCFHSKDQSF